MKGFLERKNKEWNCFDRIKNVDPYPKDNKSHIRYGSHAKIIYMLYGNP